MLPFTLLVHLSSCVAIIAGKSQLHIDVQVGMESAQPSLKSMCQPIWARAIVASLKFESFQIMHRSRSAAIQERLHDAVMRAVPDICCAS